MGLLTLGGAVPVGASAAPTWAPTAAKELSTPKASTPARYYPLPPRYYPLPPTPPPAPPPTLAPGPPASPQLLTPFPRISIAGRARRFSTLITKFVVRAPRGSRVTIRCRGRSCPFRRTSTRARRRPMRFRRLQRAFRTGTAIEVFVTSRDKIGKYTRFRFRRRRAPRRADGCLNPGTKKPTRCP